MFKINQKVLMKYLKEMNRLLLLRIPLNRNLSKKKGNL